jgi:hypothetical protein
VGSASKRHSGRHPGGAASKRHSGRHPGGAASKRHSLRNKPSKFFVGSHGVSSVIPSGAPSGLAERRISTRRWCRRGAGSAGEILPGFSFEEALRMTSRRVQLEEALRMTSRRVQLEEALTRNESRKSIVLSHGISSVILSGAPSGLAERRISTRRWCRRVAGSAGEILPGFSFEEPLRMAAGFVSHLAGGVPVLGSGRAAQRKLDRAGRPLTRLARHPQRPGVHHHDPANDGEPGARPLLLVARAVHLVEHL